MGGFVIIAGIVLMVIIHEGGHFIAAKSFDIKATQAFFGFGPTLWSIQRGETEYGVKAIPLGGFVKIIGMNPLEDVGPEDEGRAYRVKPFWQKTVVVLAGIASHFVVAFLLFWVVAVMWGTSRLPEPVLNPTISSVGPLRVEGERPGPAFTWAVQPGDTVVAIGGLPIADVAKLDRESPVSAALTILREGEELTLDSQRFFFTVEDELRGIDGVAPGDLDVGLDLPDVMVLTVFDVSEQLETTVVSSSLPLRTAADDDVVAINDTPIRELTPFVDEGPGDLVKVTVLRDGATVDLFTDDRVAPAPAFLVGALEGDRILLVDDVVVSSWDDFTTAVRDRPGQETTVLVERDDQEVKLTTVLATRTTTQDGVDREIGFFGVRPTDDVNPFRGLAVAAENVVFGTRVAALGLWDLVANIDAIVTATVRSDDEVLNATRPISVIGLVRIAGPVESSLVLLAIVNIFVGLLNVIPLYPLDGGHFAVALYEKIRGRPADVRKLLPVAAAVFVFILGLGVLGLYLDWFNPFEFPGQ